LLAWQIFAQEKTSSKFLISLALLTWNLESLALAMLVLTWQIPVYLGLEYELFTVELA